MQNLQRKGDFRILYAAPLSKGIQLGRVKAFLGAN